MVARRRRCQEGQKRVGDVRHRAIKALQIQGQSELQRIRVLLTRQDPSTIDFQQIAKRCPDRRQHRNRIVNNLRIAAIGRTNDRSTRETRLAEWRNRKSESRSIPRLKELPPG